VLTAKHVSKKGKKDKQLLVKQSLHAALAANRESRLQGAVTVSTEAQAHRVLYLQACIFSGNSLASLQPLIDWENVNGRHAIPRVPTLRMHFPDVMNLERGRLREELLGPNWRSTSSASVGKPFWTAFDGTSDGVEIGATVVRCSTPNGHVLIRCCDIDLYAEPLHRPASSAQ
jgi:hypothetical protein